MAKARPLNPDQKEFCRLYATEKEFFGNGVHSYAEAYDVDLTKKGGYSSAGAGACRLLKDSRILAYINEIMEQTGFNDQFADKQLSFLMTQSAELGVKLGAIRHYSDLKQRVKQKLELTGKDGGPVQIVTFAGASKQ